MGVVAQIRSWYFVLFYFDLFSWLFFILISIDFFWSWGWKDFYSNWIFEKVYKSLKIVTYQKGHPYRDSSQDYLLMYSNKGRRQGCHLADSNHSPNGLHGLHPLQQDHLLLTFFWTWFMLLCLVRIHVSEHHIFFLTKMIFSNISKLRLEKNLF